MLALMPTATRSAICPIEAKSLFEDLLAQHPELRIFQLSPATAALDLAAKAFPIFQPRTKMSDPYPLTVPPILPPVPGLPPPPVAANLLAAVSMVAIGALVLSVGTRRRWRITSVLGMWYVGVEQLTESRDHEARNIATRNTQLSKANHDHLFSSHQTIW